MKPHSFRAFALISFLAAASAFTGCSGSVSGSGSAAGADDDVFPSAVLVTSRSTSALVSTIESIEGV